MSEGVDATSISSASSAVTLTYREAITAAIEDEMAADPAVILIGEDVATAGGVFKTNEGLAERFGRDRVRNTPICENTFLGVALGMAVTGLRPIVEIMFSDFLPTAGDAIVNELPKFRFMSGGQCTVPLTVRSIGGGTGRFGTQHSATGESWFLQLPGMKVVTLSTPAAAYATLRAAVRDEQPVLVYEHKGLYNSKGPVVRDSASLAPVGTAEVMREGRDITVVGTMLMLNRALTAAQQIRDSVDVEVIDLRWLRPMDTTTVEKSVARTGRLLVVEEQVHTAGWGATIISQLAMRGMRWKARPRSLSLPDDAPIPYSPPLEDELIPSVQTVAEAIRSIMAEG